MQNNKSASMQAFRNLMVSKDILSHRVLAERLNISPSTLSQHVKSFLEGNSSSKFEARLAKALNLSMEKLESFKNTIGSTDPLFTDRFIDKKVRELEEDRKSYIEEITSLFENLSKGDKYFFVTYELPFEYNISHFRNALNDAIKRGAEFHYIFPDNSHPSFVEQFSDFYNPFDSGWKSLHESHKKFVSLFAEEYGYQKVFANRYLRAFKSSNPFLVNPLFKLIYVEQDVFGQVQKRAFIEQKVGIPSSEGGEPVWFPLPLLQIERIQKAIKQITE